MTTALLLLRCVELGLSITDLDHLTIGMVIDMYTEKEKDSDEPVYKASQEDMNRF